jgi:hypothetical protein
MGGRDEHTHTQALIASMSFVVLVLFASCTRTVDVDGLDDSLNVVER